MKTQESGIYDHWLSESEFNRRNSFRVIDPIVDQISIRYDFEAIPLNKLSGIFYVYIIGKIVTILVFAIELSFKLLPFTIFTIHVKSIFKFVFRF
jgi:hypothetical protein